MAWREDHRVFSIDPTSRGFGFAVLEGAGTLIDWGTRDLGRADSGGALREIGGLLDHYTPDVIVVEDTTHRSSRRRTRVRSLIKAAGQDAAARGVSVDRVSRSQVLDLFEHAGATAKNRIAEVIAEHFPEISPHVPPFRKPWMSEDVRMSIFDAVAFALVHYYRLPEVRTPGTGRRRTPEAPPAPVL
jgi:Holliday junction resolvasome RuvABC endonuclease subunit